VNVWLLMPTAKPDRGAAAVERWRAQGYKVAVYVNDDCPAFGADLFIRGKYEGYWHAMNWLSRYVFRGYGADVCLFAGDDMDPDPKRTAQEIGREYLQRFPDGFGIMQPCGDPQGVDASGHPAARRICGSAWFGKGWAERAYGGRGPTDERYWHFYADEDLKEIAEKLSVIWWRPDLTQYHRHWSWGHMPIQPYHQKNQTHWEADYARFCKNKAEGFANGEPLPAEAHTR
jgi:hypothetical protein